LGGAFKAISYNFLKNSLIADTGVIVPAFISLCIAIFGESDHGREMLGRETFLEHYLAEDID
jgi:hypothetical protein